MAVTEGSVYKIDVEKVLNGFVLEYTGDDANSEGKYYESEREIYTRIVDLQARIYELLK